MDSNLVELGINILSWSKSYYLFFFNAMKYSDSFKLFQFYQGLYISSFRCNIILIFDVP